MNRCARPIALSALVATLTLASVQYVTAESAKPAPKAVPVSGKVMETLNGGGYTYVLLNNGSDKVWVAAPQMKVSVGQQLTLMPGYEMRNFSSKTLNRKFDRVIFSGGVANQEPGLSSEAIQKAHQGVPVEKLKGAIKPEKQKELGISAGATATPAVPKKVKVAKAKGRNAYTIAELYGKKGKLEKKPVVVRGTVVKVSARILKRNWIHIEDGSGSAGEKTNDLIITSKEIPKVGDVVTASGTLYNNMDFGSGYRYGLIIEGAHFSR